MLKIQECRAVNQNNILILIWKNKNKVNRPFLPSYLKDVPEVEGKCPYFKCSLVTSEKIYRIIFGVNENKEISKEEIRAM